MARKSRYAVELKEEKKTAMLLAGVYTRLSIEDEDDEEQNSIGNQKKIALDYLKRILSLQNIMLTMAIQE